MSLPPTTPVEVTVEPPDGVDIRQATHVVAGGLFDHDKRTQADTYSRAVHAVASGSPTAIPAFTDRITTALEAVTDLDTVDRLVIAPAHDGETNPAVHQLATTLPIPFSQAVRRDDVVDPNKSIPDNRTRWENVADSVTATTSLTGETVVVLDDVLASGATLATTASILRDADATTVIGAVLGLRTPNPHTPTPVSASAVGRTN